MLNDREQEHRRTERLRGWIVYLLYKAYTEGRPMELAVLLATLDACNFPLTRRRLAAELVYLKSVKLSGREEKGLLRLFPVGADEEIDPVRQAKLLQRYAEAESDSEARLSLCVVLTANGIDFQQHNAELASVHRVE